MADHCAITIVTIRARAAPSPSGPTHSVQSAAAPQPRTNSLKYFMCVLPTHLSRALSLPALLRLDQIAECASLPALVGLIFSCVVFYMCIKLINVVI